jgi:hypothetical protein
MSFRKSRNGIGVGRNVRRRAFLAPVEELESRLVPSLLGQQLFPADNPWNERITNAPVAANSAAIMNNIVSRYGDGRLHPDFGQDYQTVNTPLYGIPYNVVHGNSVAKVHVVIDAYPNESDLQNAPIPANAVIEGDMQTGPTVGVDNRGDSHLLIWDADNNIAYEFYRASRPSENTDGQWHADQETVWNMKANTFRTLGWTSADAAGLSILAGLVRPDEGLPTNQGGQGVINHAIRFTLQNALVLNQYVYPASHTANPGNTNATIMPPMGMRFRLKASVDISQLGPEARIIAQAMKDYGLILADNGSNFFFSGTSYAVNGSNQIALTWNDNDIQDTLHGLKSLHYSDFEVVDTTPVVSGLSNASGPAGSTVTVIGQNFTGAAGHLQVLFANTPATNVTVLDDAHLTAVVPAGSGTVDVRVVSAVSSVPDTSNYKNPIFGNGFSAVTANDRFTYGSTSGPSQVQLYVSQVYVDLLQRPVDSAGLASWTQQLNQGLARTQFIHLIEASQEYRSDVVQALYHQVLGRGVDPAGLASWVNFLGQGNSADQLEIILLGSAEFFARVGGTNAAFVRGLYQTVLNRPVDPAGAQAWAQALAQGATRNAVAAAILGSIEADADEVQAYYARFLRRPADSAGLNAWVYALQHGLRQEDFIADLLSSDEYYAKA